LSALEGTLSVMRWKDGRLADRELQGPAKSGDAVRCTDLDGERTRRRGVPAAHRSRRPCAQREFRRRTGPLVPARARRARRRGARAPEISAFSISTATARSGDRPDPEGGKVAIVPIRRVKDAGVAFGEARAIDVPSGPKALALIDAR
jgi:hypothetical protein